MQNTSCAQTKYKKAFQEAHLKKKRLKKKQNSREKKKLYVNIELMLCEWCWCFSENEFSNTKQLCQSEWISSIWMKHFVKTFIYASVGYMWQPFNCIFNVKHWIWWCLCFELGYKEFCGYKTRNLFQNGTSIRYSTQNHLSTTTRKMLTFTFPQMLISSGTMFLLFCSKLKCGHVFFLYLLRIQKRVSFQSFIFLGRQCILGNS